MPPGESPTTIAVAPRMVQHLWHIFHTMACLYCKWHLYQSMACANCGTCRQPMCDVTPSVRYGGAPRSWEDQSVLRVSMTILKKVPIERATLSCVWYCWPFILSFLQESFLDCETPTNGSIKMLSLATCPAIFLLLVGWLWLMIESGPEPHTDVLLRDLICPPLLPVWLEDGAGMGRWQ